MAWKWFQAVKEKCLKLTNVEAAIVGQLVASAGSELYGLQLVKEGNDIKRGSVYVFLGRLEDKGLVESRREEVPGLPTPRRLYKVTGAGVKHYRAWLQIQEIQKQLSAGFDGIQPA